MFAGSAGPTKDFDRLYCRLRSLPRNLRNPQNKGHYVVQGYSRSFKVTDFGSNRKLIYDFLLVININLPPILHRF